MRGGRSISAAAFLPEKLHFWRIFLKKTVVFSV